MSMGGAWGAGLVAPHIREIQRYRTGPAAGTPAPDIASLGAT